MDFVRLGMDNALGEWMSDTKMMKTGQLGTWRYQVVQNGA